MLLILLKRLKPVIHPLFLVFKRYQKRRQIYNWIKKGLQNPFLIPSFLINKFTDWREKWQVLLN
jgi:hypothetical protein